MVHIIADRVADTSASTGTGDFTVTGTAPTRFETLSTVLSTGDTFDYIIQHQSVDEWELGIGTYQGANVFARTTVKQSTNSDALVNFSAGNKSIALIHSADRIKNPRWPNGSGIYDDSGNELLTFAKTASATNELEIANAATGNNPSLSAKGGDTNIGLNLITKGNAPLLANGTHAISAVRVRVAAAANVNLASDLENGDILNGVTLATGDLVLIPSQSTGSQNGIYPVVASGAASRARNYDSWDALVGLLVSVTEGTLYADTVWQCTANKGGTLGSTSVTFQNLSVPSASDTTPGIAELATNAETLLLADATRAVTPAGLGALLQAKKATALVDDSATSFSVSANTTGFMILQIHNVLCILYIDNIPARGLTAFGTSLDPSALLVITTGALTGTTGTDGKITVSIHTDDKIYIENRAGGTVIYNYFVFI